MTSISISIGRKFCKQDYADKMTIYTTTTCLTQKVRPVELENKSFVRLVPHVDSVNIPIVYASN